MQVLSTVRQAISDRLWWHTITRHRSRLFYLQARKFTQYLNSCQRTAPVAPQLDAQLSDEVAKYNNDAYAAFSTPESARLAQSILTKIRTAENSGQRVWDSGSGGNYVAGDAFKDFPEMEELFRGVLGRFINGVFGTHFQIHSGELYKSVRLADQAQGSQLWHADGGPGTCMNLMFCISQLSPANGAMKCVPWPSTLEIYRKERPIVRARTEKAIAQNPGMSRMERRKILSDFYREEIEGPFRSSVAQPVGEPGIIYAFSNNTIHAGGFPDIGHERIVCVFHIYPSCRPTDYDWYRANGVKKQNPYPRTPDELDRRGSGAHP